MLMVGIDQCHHKFDTILNLLRKIKPFSYVFVTVEDIIPISECDE